MAKKKSVKKEIPKFAWIVLLGIGCFDILRGLLHTVFIDFAITSYAQFDMNGPQIGDLKVMMTSFGISNLITGLLLISIALKARQLVEIALIGIPLAYLVGVLSMRLYNIVPQSALLGRHTMTIYLGVCVITFFASKLKTYLETK